MKKLFLALSVLLATFSGYTSGAAGCRTMPVNSDANGTAVFKASYDAWGKQTVTAGTFKFHRGFTGHEHLPEFALINMNGRMYDPILGRFLSPDPYVQAPEFSQNFNRYSYCLNNPLVYTDPSGEWLHLIAGAVIGGITNLMMNANNIHNFWQGLGYFGVGAASGALGAGVGAGISSAIAGGSFGAGFVGSSAAMTATSSFISGAAIGGGAGFSAGFVSGLGNGLMNGQKFDKALGQGTVYGLIGGGSGALLGGIAGGIDAARDDRRFWDGATVTKRYAADVSIVPVKQEGLNNCLPASGESVNKSLGGNITQNDFRAKAGGDPNLNPINEEYFWKDIYVNETGHTVKSYSAQNYGRFGAGQIAPELNSGGRVAVTIYGAENIEHSVVVKSVYFQTVTKVNGTATRTWMFRVMDPATGGFRNIPQNKLINVFIIKP